MSKLILQLMFIASLLGHTIYAGENDINQNKAISIEALNYINEILNVLEKGAVNRNIIDWDLVRKEAIEAAKGATAISDTYDAIRLSLTFLQENHSFFLTPQQVEILESNNIHANENQPLQSIKAEIIDDHIGYLLIPKVWALCDNKLIEYASSIHRKIQMLDQSRINKWIVDLRGNQGGHMWPMVLGLGPLLGNDVFGYFTDGSEEKFAWNYDGQSVKVDDFIILSLEFPGYQLYLPHPRVAVLVDNLTGSSGESTAIAFLGRKDTKVFGQKTAGYTTANELYRLSDGAALLLATTYNADRLGRVYKDGITPDVIISEEGDAVLIAAVKWLNQAER